MGTEDAEAIAPGTCPTASGMPMLGLGTWQNDDPEQCAQSVRTALETGYRHIDTAQAYGNEEAVGDGIAAADVDREDVFLATKLWHSNLAYDDVLETARDSLDRLGVDSLDLLYVHWPSGTYDPEETLSALSELYDECLIENVGVSNFLPSDLEVAVDVCDAPIFANQVELHPLLPRSRSARPVRTTISRSSATRRWHAGESSTRPRFRRWPRNTMPARRRSASPGRARRGHGDSESDRCGPHWRQLGVADRGTRSRGYQHDRRDRRDEPPGRSRLRPWN